MHGQLWRQSKGFLFALAAVATAIGVRETMVHWFATDLPFLVSIAAVFVVAWYGGLWPGVVATALTLVTMPWVGLDDGTARTQIGADLHLALYVAIALLISALCEAGTRYRARLRENRRHLDDERARRADHEATIDKLYAQLRLTTDNAPVFIAHCDAGHRFKFVNKPFADLFQRSPESIVGRSIAEVIGPRRYAIIEPTLQSALSGQAVRFELAIPCGDTETRWAQVAYQPEIDLAVGVVGYVAAVIDITAQKRTEEELRVHQERLELAQKAAGVGMFEWDMVSDRRLWSPALEALFGYPEGGYDGTFEEWKRRVHPADWANVEAAMERARTTGADPRGEYRIVRQDGDIRWVASRGKIFTDANGTPVRMIGVKVDITERKRAESKLRQRERMLAQSQRMAHVGGWELDLNDLNDFTRNPLRWTDESYRIFGYEPGAVTVDTERFFELIHPGDRVRILEAVLEALRHNRPYEIEHRIVRSDGAERVLHQWGTFVYASDGRPVRILGTMQDVTERREIEEALRASEARFRQLADAMPQIAWTTDGEGRLMYVNQRWHDYTGLRAANAPIDTLLEHIVHPDDAPAARRAWRVSQASGEDHEHQVRLRRGADSAYRWFLCRGVPVKDKHGAVAHWFFTATDIEAQKRAEEALREADRRKDEFLATLAHELRNPLAPIRHGLQLLRLPGSNDATREKARRIMERQSAQMTRLIDDLLDISRISRGTLELRRDWIELQAAVQSAIETCAPLMENAGHRLEVALDADTVLLNADLTRLAQVFANLLNNAAKYTPPGGRIRLGAQCRDGTVVVTVTDDGIGIPREKLQNIFDMFVQLDRSLENPHGGLGIGLTLAKRLIEMHGGTLEAHSDGPGTGATFTVRLPAVVVGRDIPARPDPKAAAAAATRGGLSILIADDNRDSAESLSTVLQLMGYETATAHDGVTALAVAERLRPDVVLLDIGMPRLNGYDTARRLRATPWGKKALLIALTGWGQESDKRRAQEAGFDHHVTKPLEPTSIEPLLARRAMRPAETASPSA